MKRNLLFSLLVVLAVLLAIACSTTPPPSQIIVDNPTDSIISVTIGNDTLEINAKSSKVHTLPAGVYKVKYADSTYSFEVEQMRSTGIVFILNPTRSAYILEQAVYTKNFLSQKRTNHNDRIPFDTIRVMNLFDISGNFKRTDDLVIDDSYDFGLNTDFPQSVELSSYETEKLMIKIFREKDFLFSKLRKEDNTEAVSQQQ